MAEVMNQSSVSQAKQAPAPSPQPPKQAVLADVLDMTQYKLTVKEFDAAANKVELSCPLPDSTEFAEWSIMQQVIMLKKGMWKSCTIPDILWGLAYARRIGADVMLGELFPSGEGRWGTSNKFKIKEALKTGKIKGFSVDIRDTGEKIELSGCIQKTDLECTVSLDVDGFTKPVVRKARLSRWFMGTNPNWKGRPEHMLELNTFAHACEYIVPGGTEPDEAPPLTLSVEKSSSPAIAPPSILSELKKGARIEEPSLLEQLEDSVQRIEESKQVESVTK
jgi:hypothetical protein